MGVLDATRDWSKISQELNTPLEVERGRGLLERIQRAQQLDPTAGKPK